MYVTTHMHAKKLEVSPSKETFVPYRLIHKKTSAGKVGLLASLIDTRALVPGCGVTE
jgi:hypothetical protein